MNDQGRTVDREAKFVIPINSASNDHPWVDYHIRMRKLHMFDVGTAQYFNEYNDHGDRCNVDTTL